MPDTVSRPPVAGTPAATAEPVLDAERLAVYRVALEFQALATSLVPPRGQSALRNQLDRAGASIALNIAEGAGRFSPLDKARFHGIARGSAMECAAVPDVLLTRGVIAAPKHRHGRGLLLRVVQMISKLNARMLVSAG